VTVLITRKLSFIRRLGLTCSLAMVFMIAGATEKETEATAGNKPLDETEQFFILANLEFTLLHEFSHLLIDELKLPVLGMEEDAADRIALVAMQESRRHQSAREAIPWLFAVAGDWYTEWEIRADEDGVSEAPAYWDNHPLEIQRFYNIVCLIVGGNGDLLDDLINAELLPFARAVSCEREYQQASRAVQWVLDSYGRAEEAGLMSMREGIALSYERPRPGRNQQIYELLRASRFADQLAQRFWIRFKLPRTLKVEFENCAYTPDAYWHAGSASVTLCYELLDRFRDMAGYRREHSQRACGIPSLRNLMGQHLQCKDQAPDGPGLKR